MTTVDVTVSLHTGEFRTFGQFGPAYQIVEVRGNEAPLRVRVLESGEELDYPISRAVRDPEAA